MYRVIKPTKSEEKLVEGFSVIGSLWSCMCLSGWMQLVCIIFAFYLLFKCNRHPGIGGAICACCCPCCYIIYKVLQQKGICVGYVGGRPPKHHY